MYGISDHLFLENFCFRIAQKLCLKTRSYGSGSKRHLVVSKRLPEQGNIIHTLLSCGGENERYRLILPSNF